MCSYNEIYTSFGWGTRTFYLNNLGMYVAYDDHISLIQTQLQGLKSETTNL